MYICLEAVNEWTKQHQLIPTTAVKHGILHLATETFERYETAHCAIFSPNYNFCIVLYGCICTPYFVIEKKVLTSSSYLFVKFRLLKYIQQELASNNNLFGSHNCWHKTCSKNGLQHNDHCYNQSKEQIYTAFCTKLTSPKL